MLIPPPTVLVIQDHGAAPGPEARLEEGCLTIRASGAERGYELARARLPNLIAVDVSAHSAGGWAVCRLLKHDRLTASIPLVVVNASNTTESYAHAGYVGALAVFTGPASLREWLAAVDTLSGSSAA